MCTTCRLQFEVGEPSRITEAERERLTERELLGQARLSCQISCEGEVVVKPLMTVSTSGTDSPGARPADEITPEPRWTEL